ncbi:MAG: YicC family protein [Lachnospiraceae bacterium]|nr:YicC family protein [Lachnospiraceae bacterium]
MIKSMTGFGRYELVNGGRKITVEMKSVNHRYSEITIKMPKKLNFFEAGIRNILKEYISRGKVDMFISYEDDSEGRQVVKYNEDLAKEYFEAINKIADTFELSNELQATTIARMPEVLVMEEQSIDEDDLWKDVEAAVRGCAEKFVETRIAEGEKLRDDLFSKLDGIFEMVEKIEKRSPEIVKEYREKIIAKVTELLGDNQISETVLANEIILFADKICTDEEMVRLRAHVSNMKDTLTSGKDIGRKLDFIAQEMNREANTTLSKANDMEISNIAIDLKTEIEKIREQIQNIE